MKEGTPLRGTVSGGGEVRAVGDGVVQEGLSDKEPLSQNPETREAFPTVHFVRCLHFCLSHVFLYSLGFLLTPAFLFSFFLK